MPNGSLSLPARLCLLAWDATGTDVTRATRLPHLVRAGALTELAQRGLLADEDGIATPADMDSGTGDAVLDGLLELVRESRPHRWRTWVTLRSRITLDAVREQLTADGHLRAERKRVLGVFPTVDHALDSAAVVDALHDTGCRVVSSATTVAQAEHLAARRAEAVIAQGAEAGGHRGSFLVAGDDGPIGALALVPQVVDAIDVPVIAAGIGDGRRPGGGPGARCRPARR